MQVYGQELMARSTGQPIWILEYKHKKQQALGNTTYESEANIKQVNEQLRVLITAHDWNKVGIKNLQYNEKIWDAMNRQAMIYKEMIYKETAAPRINGVDKWDQIFIAW